VPGTGKSESRWRSCVDGGWESARVAGKEKARGLPRARAGFAAGVAVPSQPAKRIAERMDFAALTLVDDPDRYKPDGVTGSSEAPEDFGFDFEMAGRGGEVGPGIEVHEAKAVLGIREFAAGEAGELAAHPAVDLATEPRHARGMGHAIAHDEAGAGLFGALEEGREILGRMLAVTVHGHRPGEPLLTRRRPAMNQSGAFALGMVMAEDPGAGGLRESAGTVGGTVVDHEDVGEVALDTGDEVTDGQRLVETRDDHATVRAPIHGGL
jgi:hypothetical protein